MKVTGIRHEKHKGDGTGVVRVIIDYEVGTKAKTATLYADTLTGESRFGSDVEFREHIGAADALNDIAEAALTLIYYGWEA